VLKTVYTLAGGPVNFKVIGKSGTGYVGHIIIMQVLGFTQIDLPRDILVKGSKWEI
jgi:hypothetical protein